MAEALAAAVAGRRAAVLAGPQQVVEVEAQLALVDHARRLAGRALVVDRVGPPLAAASCRRRRRSRSRRRASRRAGPRTRRRASARRRTRGRARWPRGTARRRSRCRPRPASGPAGAGRASSIVSARRAASSATAAGSPSNSSKPAWPASDSHARLDAVVAARHHLRPEPHARAVVRGRAARRSWPPGPRRRPSL